ncbi:MAG TPA: hypothetical protein VJ997_02790, partial [Longimicrobiales bacterium]|nr:hypothetical protein [Longimicrobiales bacterium]
MRPRSLPALLILAAAVVAAVAPVAAAGQELARRVAETSDGTVRFSFAVREGVEICARGIRIHENRVQWHGGRAWEGYEDCGYGPAEVEVRVADGR